jgi:hypothetical protein
MRLKPISGTKYFAGTVIREDGRMGRHVAVLFKCAHCPNGIGRARFSCLKADSNKHYQTKSCRCKEGQRFDSYHRRKAGQLNIKTVKAIFECCVMEGLDIAANRFKISKYLANFAWQRWCQFLESLPEHYRGEIYDACQISMPMAISMFGLTTAELMRICRHWRQNLGIRDVAAQSSDRARHEARAEAIRLFEIHAPVGSLTGSVFTDALLYLESAVEISREESFEIGRYPGELTSKELASSTSKRRSDYGWVYRTADSMYRFQVAECFGQLGVDFLKVCRRTFAQRRKRKNNYLNSLVRPSRRPKCTDMIPRNRVRYLPKPTAHPLELATLMVEHVPALKGLA